MPSIKCITTETTIGDAEDLDLTMLMYNLLEFSSNYSETTDSLSFYCKKFYSNFNNDAAHTNDFKSFKYKAKLLGETEADEANGILKNTIHKDFCAIKYLSNFSTLLEMLLINCKVDLKLKLTKHCVLSANGNIVMMLILIILLLLSKTQNYMFPSSRYQ